MKIPWEMEKRDFITVICCFVCLFLTTFNIVSVSSNLGAIQNRYSVAYSVVSAFSQILAVSYVIFFMIAIAFTDKHGKKVSLITGLSIFAVTSFLSAIAWDMNSLIVFRLITGIGISLVQATCNSIITDLVSKKYLGDAMAVGYSFSSFGAIVAPLIGYGIVKLLGTWIIFILAVPVCIILIYLLRDIENVIVRPDLKINYPFHILYIISVSLMIGSMLSISSMYRIAMLAAGIALFIVAALIHKKSQNKVFNTAIFKNGIFTVCIIMIFMFQYASSGVENTLNQFFQFNDSNIDFFGIVISTAGFAALLMSFKPVIQVITSPLIARYYRNRDQTKQSVIGFAFVLTASVLAALLFVSGKNTIAIVMILIIYVLHALASSFFTPYNKQVMMSSVSKEDRNTASSLSSVIGTLASIFGIITLVNILNGCNSSETLNASVSLVFAIILGVSILGTIISIVVMKKTSQPSD